MDSAYFGKRVASLGQLLTESACFMFKIKLRNYWKKITLNASSEIQRIWSYGGLEMMERVKPSSRNEE